MQCGRSWTGAAVAFSCGVEETLCGLFPVRGNTGVGDLGVLVAIIVRMVREKTDCRFTIKVARPRFREKLNQFGTMHSNSNWSLVIFWPEKRKNLA